MTQPESRFTRLMRRTGEIINTKSDFLAATRGTQIVLPVPPEMQEHTEWIARLLDSYKAQILHPELLSLRSTILEAVAEELDRQSVS